MRDAARGLRGLSSLKGWVHSHGTERESADFARKAKVRFLTPLEIREIRYPER